MKRLTGGSSDYYKNDSVSAWGSHTGSAADYLTHYSKIDRFRVIQEEGPCGRLVRLSECLPESILRYDECYNDFIRVGGSCDLFGGKLYESASHMLIFGLHRAMKPKYARGPTTRTASQLTQNGMLKPPISTCHPSMIRRRCAIATMRNTVAVIVR